MSSSLPAASPAALSPCPPPPGERRVKSPAKQVSTQISVPRRKPLTVGSYQELGYNLPTAATVRTHFLVATRGADSLKAETKLSFCFPEMTACTGLILCSSDGWVYGAHIPPGAFSSGVTDGALVAHLDLDLFLKKIRDNRGDRGTIQKAYFMGNSCSFQPAISAKMKSILGPKVAKVSNAIFPLSEHLHINETTAWVRGEVRLGSGGWNLISQDKVSW